MILTLVTLGVAILLFVSDRVRLDVVAVGAMLVLLVGGVLTIPEALAGFSAPVVLLIASLFFVGEALQRTGIADRAARWLAHVGRGSETRLLIACMVVAALLSAFMSNTGAVAVLVPVVLGVAKDSRVAPSRLLIPLSFGAMLGGTLTLIGSPPNMVASGALEAAGHTPFQFFSITPIGLLLLAAGIGFFLLAGRHLLPDRKEDEDDSDRIAVVHGEQLVEEYRVRERAHLARVGPDSPCFGKRLRDLDLPGEHGIEVLMVFDDLPVTPDTVLRGEVVVRGPRAAIEECGFQLLAWEEANDVDFSHLEAAELLLTPRSRLVGRTLVDSRFRQRYGLQAVGILRRGEPIEGELGRVKLHFGDVLFVRGPSARIRGMSARRADFVVVSETGATRRPPESRRAPIALGIVAAMLAAMASGVLPAATAAMLAAFAAVVSGCVRLPSGYRAVNWESLILIAAMLPMATALEKTGGLGAAVDLLVTGLGGAGPLALMAGLFWAAALLSLVMSNTATAVLLVPVAIQSAEAVGASPWAFAMTVAVAASTAFSTPMATPTNTMVLTPGGYRFGDYVKTGFPLQLIVFALTMALVPLLYG